MTNFNSYFEEIDFGYLEKRVIFLDVDGTLVFDRGSSLDRTVLKQLEKLKIGNRIFLCTNSNDKIRNAQIEQALNLPIVNRHHKKPSPKIIQNLGIHCASEELLVIGDKYLTDGIFARNISAQFIKVRRKLSGQETFFVKLINWFDDAICQLIS